MEVFLVYFAILRVIVFGGLICGILFSLLVFDMSQSWKVGTISMLSAFLFLGALVFLSSYNDVNYEKGKSSMEIVEISQVSKIVTTKEVLTTSGKVEKYEELTPQSFLKALRDEENGKYLRIVKVKQKRNNFLGWLAPTKKYTMLLTD